MNKIFKHKRGASGLKVVCEFAKSHCSSGEKTAVNSGAHVSTRSGFKSLSIALISALTLGIATPAMAGQQFGIGASSSGGTDATAGGRGAKASGLGSTAIGSNTEASGVVSAALGSRSKAADGQSVAVGDRVVARGKEATAIGSDTVAADVSSIAIGSDNTTGYDNKQAFENVRVITADDLKNNKELISALDKLCDSLKYNNNGNCSTTYGISKNNANGTYEISNIDTFYSFFPTLSDGVGSIAIGARTITANKGSTAIGSLSVAIGEKSSAFGLQSKASNVQSLALGAGSLSSGNQATAVGNDVAAIGKSSIAIGNDDLTNTANGTNDGYMNNVMVDLTELNNPNSEIRKVYDAAFSKNNVRLKDYGLIYENNQYRFINASDVGQNITGASGLTYKSDEVGNQNKFSQTISSGIGSIAVGSRSLALGKGATTIGSLAKATGEESTALGSFSKATASKAIAIGRDSIANIENSVALGVSSKTDYAGMNTKAYVPSLGYVMPMANSVGVISVGSSNQQRRIVNLAPGALDTDAVNVSQLKSLAESLGMDGLNDSKDKMMRYLSVEKATGDASIVQAPLAKEKAFKTYAELRKMKDMMALNENATGGTYDQGEKDKINKQITDLQNKYNDFEAEIATPTTEINSITTSSSEDKVKALTDKINAYTDTNPFALTQAQKNALKNANATNEGATGADSIAIGYGAKTKENAANAIAIGKSSNATDTNTIAIGNNAKANGESSINIGEGVAADNVLGANSVLIGSAFGDIAKTNTSLKIESSTIAGTDLKIEGKKIDKSVIIGSRHEIGQETTDTNKLSQNVIVGEKIRLDNSDQAVTIGSDIVAKDSKGGIAIGGDDAGLVSGYPKTEIQGKGAIAIGVSARAVKDAAMSLGVNSQTTVAQGVALGFNSTADRASIVNKTDAYNGSDTNVADTIKGSYGAVSVGNSGATRQIINVAAGSADTDAVNVAQLKSVSDAISFNVKGKDSAGANDITNSIKSGKTVEFASDKEYLKIKHTTTTDGNSKFTFDIDQETLKTKIGTTSGGDYQLDFSGDRGAKITRDKTSKELKIKGGVTTTADLSTGNIGVEASGDTLNIKLAKALKGLTSAEFVGGTDGGKTVINGDGVSYNKTDNLKPDGSAIDPKQTVSLGKDGISAGGKTISNVGEAQKDGDAVNKKQAETIAQDEAKKAIDPTFLKNKIEAGTNIASIVTEGAGNDAKLKINANGAKVAAGDGLALQTSAVDSNNNTTYTLGLDQSTKDKLASIDTISSTANGAMKNFKVIANGETGNDKEATIAGGETLNFKAGNNLVATLNKDGKTVTYAMKDGVQFNDITAGKNGTDGTDGKVSVNGKDGGSVVINGKDGSIGLTGANGTNGLTIKGGDGVNGVDGTSITRIVYTENGKEHKLATLDDGLKFGGNDGETSKKLNTKFDIKGASTSTDWTNFDAGKNIMTQVGTDGVMTIALAKALTGLTSAEFKNATGDTTTINGDKITINPNGNTDPDKKVSLGKDGISAGGKTISNVGDAQNDGDAVNMKQMNETINKAIGVNNANTALTFAGDVDNTKAKNGKITISGGQTDTKKLSDKPNIGVVAKDGKLDIKLAKDIVVDSVTADKITAGGVTIADGKISGVTSAVDPNGELAKELKAIDNKAGKSDAEKAAAKKTAIKDALDKVDNDNVATVGDLKNVTNGLDSVVENVNNITNNVTNITNITNMVANSDDKKNIDEAAKASKKYQDATSNEEKQKIAEEAKGVVENNKIKTYNPYETTIKNNTTIVEAIQNMNERGIKFIHVSAENNLGINDDFAFDSDDSRANKEGSIGIGMKAASTAANAIATGTKSEASGANSIATGINSKASGENAIAMGNGAQATGENSISIGTGNIVTGKGSSAIGDPNNVTGYDSHARGNNNIIASDNTMVFGNSIKVDKGIDQAVAFGNQAKISVASGVALGANSNADRPALTDKKSAYNGEDKGVRDTIRGDYGAVSVGNEGATRQIINVAAGRDDSDAVNVAQLKAATSKIMASTNGISMSGVTIDSKTGKQVNFIDVNKPTVTNTGVNSVAIGANSVANRANTVSVGSAGNERIIANVADGVAPTDAANMRQLQSVANMVGEVKKDAMAGTASAMAIGNLPQATIPGKGMMAIGAGYYKGQTATALGVSKMSENGRWVFKASASYDSQRNVGAAGAVGFHF